MNHTTRLNIRRCAALPLAASLLLLMSQVSAQPPSAQSPATNAASEAYQVCLAKTLSSLPTVATLKELAAATDACATEEAALSASVLKENPDRPLFAQSFAATLKDEAIAQAPAAKLAAANGVKVTLAQQTRP